MDPTFSRYNTSSNIPGGSPVEPAREGIFWEAMLAYIPVLCLYPWAIQDSIPGLKTHARQGMILFSFELVIVLIRSEFIYRMIWLGLVILALLGMWAVFQGMSYRLPLLADLTEKLFGKERTEEK